MVRRALAAALASMAVILAGCSARSEIAPDSFQSAAEGAGFTVTQEESEQDVAAYYTAVKEDAAVSYFEFNNASDAQAAYASLKKSIATSGASVVESDAFCKYSVTNGEIYHIIIRSGTTLVYAKSPSSQQEYVDQLVDSLAI